SVTEVAVTVICVGESGFAGGLYVTDFAATSVSVPVGSPLCCGETLQITPALEGSFWTSTAMASVNPDSTATGPSGAVATMLMPDTPPPPPPWLLPPPHPTASSIKAVRLNARNFTGLSLLETQLQSKLHRARTVRIYRVQERVPRQAIRLR